MDDPQVSEVEDQARHLAGFARHFLDWATLASPLDCEGRPELHVPAIVAAVTSHLWDYARHTESVLGGWHELLNRPDPLSDRDDSLARAMLPGYLGFSPVFYEILARWGFRHRPDDVADAPRFDAPGAEAPGRLRVDTGSVAAMERGVLCMERVVQHRVPLVGRLGREYFVSQRGVVHTARPASDRVRIAFDGERSAIIVDGVEHRPVPLRQALIMRAIIEADGRNLDGPAIKAAVEAISPDVTLSNVSRDMDEMLRKYPGIIEKATGWRAC